VCARMRRARDSTSGKPACDFAFFQRRTIPLSSALMRTSSRAKQTQVMNPSCPGKVSKTPRPYLSCKDISRFNQSIFDRSSANALTAISQSAINFPDPKAHSEGDDMSAV
jgi:hypothetical protein